MQLRDFVTGCLEQHYNAMLRTVDGLSGDEMRWMPTPECSSIGFLLWHYGRTLDRWIHAKYKVGCRTSRSCGSRAGPSGWDRR